MLLNRRQMLHRMCNGFGLLGMAGLLGPRALMAASAEHAPHFAPRAKRAIYLFMSGGPPQQDLWDYKPGLEKLFNKDLPESIRGGQQLTGMTAGQTRFPIAPSLLENFSNAHV